MKTEIEQSIELCIRAINGKTEKGDDLFVLKTLDALDKKPYQGRGLGIGDTSANDFRNSWEDMAKRFVGWKESISSMLSWKDALLMLFDWANLDEDAMFEQARKIENAIFYNHLLEHIIGNCIRLPDIEKAKTLTLSFRPTHIFKDNDNFYRGYRIIAGYHARRGEAGEFFKLFKLCAPSEEKYEMSLLKAELVKGVCRKEGIAAAIDLCRHKNIGEKYYYHALHWYAEKGEYQALKEIFAAHPQLKRPENETELTILAEAYMEARNTHKPVDDDFEALFQRATVVNPKLKWGDVRLRDSILFDLGWAHKNDKERKTQCRKAIKNNWLKRELPA